MRLEEFDWNHGNNEKIRKHGVKKQEVEDFFINGDPLIFADQIHSATETRFFAFGKSNDRNIYVVFTFRAVDGRLKVRVISARFAHKKEARKFYEKKSNN